MSGQSEGLQSRTDLAPSVLVGLGRDVYDAERSRSVMRPLTDLHPNMTLEDAYTIQQEYARLRMDDGAKLVGHKIGATSRAIQELFSIDTPDFGHLFDDMLRSESEPIRLDDLIQPLVEPEIAFVLGEDMTGPGVEPGDVVDAASGVVPCLEIIDSRITDWKIRLADTVADNGSSSRFVVGSTSVSATDTDLASEAVSFERSGEIVGSGTGADVFGHPAKAAAWLVNALGRFGITVEKGATVLSGSITTAVAARPGDVFKATFSTIGTVECRFANQRDSEEVV